MKTKISLQKCREYISHIQNLSNLLGIDEIEAERIYAKLIRLEKELQGVNEYEATYCTTEFTREQREFITKNAMELLAPVKDRIIINRDPRGYAIKMIPEKTPDNFTKDWGGFGILAPEF
jgi:hypothetical protein